MRIKKGNNDRCPTIVFFALIILLAIATPASALDLSETYEDPLEQTSSVTGSYDYDTDTYYGIFDYPNTPNDLRVMYGEGGATGVEIVGEGADETYNQFVRTLSNPTTTTYTDSLEIDKKFLGILDHPAVTDTFDGPVTFNLVGEYAAQYDTPVSISGASISIDARTQSSDVWIRFLFCDLDDEEWVTDTFSVSSSWSTFSVDNLSADDLSLLYGDGDFSGATMFPMSVEILIPDLTVDYDSEASLTVDFDNFELAGVTPVPIPSTILLLGFGLIGLVGFRRKFRK